MIEEDLSPPPHTTNQPNKKLLNQKNQNQPKPKQNKNQIQTKEHADQDGRVFIRAIGMNELVLLLLLAQPSANARCWAERHLVGCIYYAVSFTDRERKLKKVNNLKKWIICPKR